MVVSSVVLVPNLVVNRTSRLQSPNGGTGQGTLTVSLIEIDKKPVFAADIFNYSVSEGDTAGKMLSSSQPITSSNPNLRNIPVYRLLSTTPSTSNFFLDPFTGQLSLFAGIAGGRLTFDAAASYPFPNTYVLKISAQVRRVLFSALQYPMELVSQAIFF